MPFSPLLNVLFITASLLTGIASARPIHVELVKKGESWQLMRNGEPFFIKGAGGDGSMQLLADSGGNSIRTWGIGDDTAAILDNAQQLGLTVTLGHWLGHTRHGFDYGDDKQLEEQFERVKRDVLKYKDHPALLMWSVGNEMEGFENGDNPVIWKHVQKIAAMIKRLDPHHPVMTVTAEIGGQRVAMLNKHCPDIDIHGINSYGGLPSIPQRYKALGGSRPYVITEYGPPGTWEIAMTSYGAPPELNSSEKAAVYLSNVKQGCYDNPEQCLGAYAFTWGSKIESTSTWYGMFDRDGNKLEVIDSLSLLWNGKPSPNLSPRIKTFGIKGDYIVKPGDIVEVTLDVVDPENEELKVNWAITGEVDEYNSAGDVQPAPLPLDGVIIESSNQGATLEMPGGGIYRLYMNAADGKGGGANASVPIKVDGAAAPTRLKLPLAVYSDKSAPTWAPSGWMGDHWALEMDTKNTDDARSGRTSLKFTYKNLGGWTGVSWQHPANDWGDKPGGFDLSGARKLTFWARSDRGGGLIDFGVGMIGKNKPHHDTLNVELKGVKLTREWKQYTINLEGHDLSSIKTPLFWTMGGKGREFSFYLDDIQFE